MSNSKFKVTGVGIDTSTINYKPSEYRCEFDSYDYIHTSISSNNDFIISDYVSYQRSSLLMTSIDFLDNFNSVIQNHLVSLNRGFINLLLFNLSDYSSWDKYGNNVKESVDLLKKEGKIVDIGLRNPKSVQDIEKAMIYLGDINFIALDICPFNFNYEIIEWCNKNEVQLIGFNCFGGHINSSNLISSFTVPYLLGFVSNYCDIVMLSGRDLYLSDEDRKYLLKLYGEDSSPKYTLKKNVLNKLTKPFKKVVETSLIVKDKEIVLPYSSPDTLYLPNEISMNLGKSNIIIPEEGLLHSKDDIVNIINEKIKLLSLPKDATLENRFAFVRYKVIESLKLEFTKDKWEFSYLKIGNNNLVISLDRKSESFSWWKKKSNKEKYNKRVFILTLTDKKISFLDVTDEYNK